MRIVIVNPNTSESVTAMLLREARLAAAVETNVSALTARSGISVIRTAADGRRAGDAVIEAFIEAGPDINVGIVGGFTEPGLARARERMAYPVTGLGEASLSEASRAGRRFSILTADETTIAEIKEMVDDREIGAQLASILTTDSGLLAVAAEQETFDTTFVELANDAAARDGADAVIFGGAVFAGMAARIEHRITVPVIDPVRAAIRRAETLVDTI